MLFIDGIGRKSMRFCAGLTLVLMVLALGCGDGTESPDVGSVDTGTDTGTLDLPIDTAPPTDPGVVDQGGGDDTTDAGSTYLPADFNQPCENTSDCDTGFCVEGSAGKVCTTACVDECPKGWTCQEVNSFGSDGVYLCMPVLVPLCQACESDDDCGSSAVAACMDVPLEGQFCLRFCASDFPCPDGYVCEVVEGSEAFCAPVTASCICTTDLLDTTRPCDRENDVGICSGLETCSGTGGWSDCDALEPIVEICDELDNNCDGAIDEPGATGCELYYKDHDSDGVGSETHSKCLCAPNTDYPTQSTGDCNDLNPSVGPGQLEFCNGMDDDCDMIVDSENSLGCVQYYRDQDGDGWGKTVDTKCLCSPVGLYSATAFGDCDDESGQTYPGSMEICNGLDDNCNGMPDEGLGGNSCTTTNALGECQGQQVCQGILGLVCNATFAELESCDSFDNDCNGVVDDPGSTGCTVFYEDRDSDGYGNLMVPLCLCAPTGDFTTDVPGDCNDLNQQIVPNMPELCNGIDDNCDAIVDEEGSLGCTVYYRDGDGDGWGLTGDSRCLCHPEGEYQANAKGDCDDSSNQIFPGAAELCNDIDDNCNDNVDESGASGCQPYLLDFDQDGYGVTGLTICLCNPVGDWTAVQGDDCDDEQVEVHPEADEFCDNIDNNCNGGIDEGCDKDGDAYCDANRVTIANPESCPMGGGDCDDFSVGVHPDADENCDSVDNDCDGEIDEQVTSPCGGCSSLCGFIAGEGSPVGYTGPIENLSVNGDGALVINEGPSEGTYSHVFEGWEVLPTQWISAGMDVDVEPGTETYLRVRAADSLAELAGGGVTPWFGPFPPALLPVNLADWSMIGRFVQLDVRLVGPNSSTTPVVHTINVVAKTAE